MRLNITIGCFDKLSPQSFHLNSWRSWRFNPYAIIHIRLTTCLLYLILIKVLIYDHCSRISKTVEIQRWTQEATVCYWFSVSGYWFIDLQTSHSFQKPTTNHQQQWFGTRWTLSPNKKFNQRDTLPSLTDVCRIT